MIKVNCYEVEIKYSGHIADYSLEDLYRMAIVKQDKRGDFTPAYTLELTPEEAKKLDGKKGLLAVYPDNHIAIFGYSFIEEN